MKQKALWIYAAALGAVLLAAAPAQPEPITFESLLGDLDNLEKLANFPNPAFTRHLASSRSLASTDPAIADDSNWFSNVDGSGYLRTELDEDGKEQWVVMEADGPGAIVRVFTSSPFNGPGTMRVYLDGSERPLIDMNMMVMLGGAEVPFIEPIAGAIASGWTSYLPIPYAKHCKVAISAPFITLLFYYDIDYLTYEPGTKVVTYSPDQANRDVDLIREVAARLDDSARPRLPKNAVSLPYSVEIQPGETRVLAAQSDGPGAVYRFTSHLWAPDMIAGLRQCVIEMSFDGQAPPQVQAPIGDFFGTVPGLNTFQSLAAGVQSDGLMYVHWVMPYQCSAEIRVTNYGSSMVSLFGETVTAPFTWSGDTMYFNAKWRTERDIPTYPRRDWTLIECEGKGQYVGSMYYFLDPTYNDMYTPWGWWGEGDDKFYIDGDAFPTMWGTGTEEYYGFGWASPEEFSHAFHSNLRAGAAPGRYGHNCLTRYHVPDPVPFNSSLKFDMEVWHWTPCYVTIAATSYWYALPGGKDSFAPPQPADLPVPVYAGPNLFQNQCGSQGSGVYAACALAIWVVHVRRRRNAVAHPRNARANRSWQRSAEREM